MFEAAFFQDSWVHIILQVTEVERDAQTVQSQLRVEFGIGFGEEILEPSVEEELVLLGAQDFSHGSAVLGLMARKTCDEILHARLGVRQ